MLNPLISLAAAIVVTLLVGLPFGNLAYGIFPGLIAFGVAWFFLGRRVLRDVQARMERVQAILQPPNMKPGMKPRFDDAIAVLVEAMEWRKWQPFIAGQIAGQIDQLYYLDKRFTEAAPYLEQASPRNWVAKAMQAAIAYRKKDKDGVTAAFEAAAKHSKKESLLWNMYAWCLWKLEDTDAAIAVLNRGVAHVGTDERTKRNLLALQNNKKLQMKGWEMMWWQFHLEKPPMMGHPSMGNKRFHGSKAAYRGR